MVIEGIISGPLLLNKDMMGHFETLEISTELVEHNVPSIEKPLELELKQLPSHLQFSYLEVGQKFLVIIATDLSDEQKCQL